jgi:predicted transcriptional regulator
MLQFLRKHLIRLMIYYAIFYIASVMIPLCPCDNKLNNWVISQRDDLIKTLQETQKENSVTGKLSKFILDLFSIK